MIEQIEKIIKMFEKSNVFKLELEIDNMKLKLEKNEITEVNSSNFEVISNDNLEVKVDDNKYVTAPVVGTFYARRSQKSAAFVDIGSNIKKGDILCIIEAMKVMNEVVASEDGVIKEILVQNEDLVEFGKKLFVIGAK